MKMNSGGMYIALSSGFSQGMNDKAIFSKMKPTFL